jgi:hypothetical protein
MTTSKADDTVDLSHGLAYGYGAETSSSTAAMMGAKSKTFKSSYTAVPTTSTFYSTTTPSAPIHELRVSMMPPPGHLIQSPASLSISDTTFTLKSFSGAANTEDKAEKWLESFLLYTDFKRMSPDDSLRLFKLLLTDQADDWLFVLHSGADPIPEILKVARISESVHLADQSATRSLCQMSIPS